LFWSGLSFAAMALNNALVVADLVLFSTAIDLALLRGFTFLLATGLLLYGLVWDVD
jgi:hypothetical protein